MKTVLAALLSAVIAGIWLVGCETTEYRRDYYPREHAYVVPEPVYIYPGHHERHEWEEHEEHEHEIDPEFHELRR